MTPVELHLYQKHKQLGMFVTIS